MPSLDEIQSYLAAAWDLMRGRPDALRRLDLSADGFWNSFLAIPLAAPPLLLIWIAATNNLMAHDSVTHTRGGIILSNVLVDLVGWTFPLVALGVVARWMGVADRFVAYVVASNWGSVIIAWLALPMALAMLTAPGTSLDTSLQLAYLALNLVLMWRLTNAAIAKGPGMATAVFLFVVVISIFATIFLQSALGLRLPDA